MTPAQTGELAGDAIREAAPAERTNAASLVIEGCIAAVLALLFAYESVAARSSTVAS